MTKSRAPFAVVALIAVLQGSAWADVSLSGTSEGALTLNSAAGTVALSYDMSLAVAWAEAVVATQVSGNASGITELIVRGQLVMSELSFGGTAAFDEASAFDSATAQVVVASDVEAIVSTVLEDGLGLCIALANSGDGAVRAIEIGLNVDEYGRVQTASCAPTFSYAAADFAFSIGSCDRPVTGSILFDEAGFFECVVACADVGGLPLGIQFASTILFEPEAKSLELNPSFSLESSECFDIYGGWTWDAVGHTVSGLEVYGLGLHYELEGISVRGMWALDPGTIALVKSPYWALLGFVWDLPVGCDLVGEASVAAFFDAADGRLFDIGQIDAEVVWPFTDTAHVTLTIILPVDGDAVLDLSWRVVF